MKNNTISPFDYVKSINDTKENIITDEWSEDQYNPFIVNKALSFTPETVIYANEMNSRPHLAKSLQYNFLINIVRKKKRFSIFRQVIITQHYIFKIINVVLNLKDVLMIV